MNPPRQPTLEQFGLAESAYAELRGRRFPTPPEPGASIEPGEACLLARLLYNGVIALLLAASCVLVAVVLLYLEDTGLGIAILGGMFAGGMTGMVAVFALQIVVIPLVRRWYLYLARRRWSDFARLEAYDEAHTKYQHELREYAQWQERTLATYWRALDGVGFEREVGRLFAAQGYEVVHTPSTGDGGVDLILTRAGRRAIVQCKAHAGRVGVGVGRELVASLRDFEADEAILVAREGVTLPLKEYAEAHGIRILELGHLLAKQRGSDAPVTLPARDPEEMYRRLMRVKRERARQQARAAGR